MFLHNFWFKLIKVCNSIVLNVHAPSEEKSNESKDSFYEKSEEDFEHFR